MNFKNLVFKTFITFQLTTSSNVNKLHSESNALSTEYRDVRLTKNRVALLQNEEFISFELKNTCFII